MYMTENKVLLINNQTHDTDLYKHSLISDGYYPVHCESLETANQIIQDQDIQITLLDYNIITNEKRPTVVNFFKFVSEGMVILYNVPENGNQRIAFYELGASRVFDTSWLAEEVYYSIRYLLHSLAPDQTNKPYVSRGRLEEMNLPNLIRTLGRERSNGVLKITSQHNSGKIYFHDGDIDEAQVGFLKGEEAVVQMLYWKKGTFTFSNIDRERTNRITLSNIGLLLLGEKNRIKLLRMLNEIGPGRTVLRLINEGDLHNSDIEIKKQFIELIRRPKTLSSIVENPFYSGYQTAQILTRLKRGGFLVIKKPIEHLVHETLKQKSEQGPAKEKKSAIQFEAKEADQFIHQFNVTEEESIKLILFGTDQQKNSQFMQNLSGEGIQQVKEHPFNMVNMQVASGMEIVLIGVSLGDAELATNTEIFKEAHGFIIWLRDEDIENLDYNAYMINKLAGLYDLPMVMAVSGVED
ncbi:MAG: DUF4388 domain-containing protein, partial [Caldithrix sp.]|nr:DUF4388 domain-containing protein [Caldithrix sp.]